MKHVKILLLTFLATLFSPLVSKAESYLCNFDTKIDTSNPNFKVASNWEHIVHKYVDDGSGDGGWGDDGGWYSSQATTASAGDISYMPYSYYTTAGVESSGTLYAGRQMTDSYGYTGATPSDYLVTPVVSGEITMQVKSSSYSSYVSFYYLDATGKAAGELIQKFSDGTGLTRDEFVTVTIIVEAPQRIGILANEVYLDDFTAADAQLEKEASIRILTADPSETTGVLRWDQQADGSVKIEFTNVTVENNGELDLTQGTKNFTISLINNDTGSALGASTPVPQDLAIGHTSDPFTVTVNIPKDQISSVWSYSSKQVPIYLRENLQGSTLKRANSMYNPYESKFLFNTSDYNGSYSISSVIDFGMVSEATTKSFKLKNDGAAPLQIVSVTLPEGFTSNFPSESFEVPAHGQTDVNITLPATSNGTFAGDLTIVYKDNSGNDKTYTVTLKGTMLGENTWWTDFNHGNSSLTYPVGSVAQSGINSDYINSNGSYNYYLKSYTSNDYATADNMFITPLLHAEAGDVMSFEVSRYNKSQYDKSNENSFIKVYISKDRENWGEPLTVLTYEDITSYDLTSHSVTIPEAGNYYVGFALYLFKLDNIIGLKQVEVAHDLYVKEVNQKETIQSGDEIAPSITVISPLKDIAAEDYTLKYFVNEKEAATIASKDLKCSAKISTDLTAEKFAVKAETTSVYETYFKFEFTDGIVFTSPVKKLTVTNDPVFVFFDKGTSASDKWQPDSRKTAISFGMGNQLGLVQNFEIYNWGTAPLTVKSITVPEGFTASIDKATVAPKTRQAVDITFSAQTAGTYEGKLAIVYTAADGTDATFELPVSGTLLDPSKWYAPFDGSNNAWPAGSRHQSNMELLSPSGKPANDYSLYSSSYSSTNNMFITPKLKAKAGETLQFDARTYASNRPEGVVELFAATTREGLEDAATRISLGKWSGEGVDAEHTLTPEFRTVSVTFDEAGEYYLGFTIVSRVYVDNIYGLTLVPVEHDVVLASSTIPADGVQNKSAIAKITLQNFGLKAEEDATYTVASYVNGVKCSEVDGTELPVVFSTSDAGVEMEVEFRSPKVGIFPVYLEVDFGNGYKLTTDPVDVTFAEETLASEVTVGTPNGFDYNVPFNLNYRSSETVALYTAADLGLSDGDKISSITVRGYSKDYSWTTHLTVCYEWTDETTQSKPSSGLYNASAMTECVNIPEYVWEHVGTATEPVDMITLKFDEPLVYKAGKSLRLYFYSTATSYKSGFNFEISNDISRAYNHHSDGTLSSWDSKKNPVLHMTLAVEARTFSPTVVDSKGNAVAGATVTLISNDGDNVQYEGTTGKDGKAAINVIQSSRTYDVKIKSASGELYMDGVSVADASFEQTVTLLDVVTIEDYTTLTEGNNAAVVYMNTTLDPGFNAIALPFAITADEAVEIFGEDAVVMELTGSSVDGTEVRAHFTTVTTGMEAGKPYMVFVTHPTTPVMFKNKAITTQMQNVETDHLVFTPTTSATALTGDMFLLTLDNYVTNGDTPVEISNAAGSILKAPAAGEQQLKSFRAYVTLKAPTATTLTFDNSQDIDTGIDSVGADTFTDDDLIYNLQGIRVSHPAKGAIYIVNGKKVVIK